MYFEKGAHLKARALFEAGSIRDYPPAMYMLGRMYWLGIGVKRDVHMARDFFERAASLGHVFSMRNLGVLLIKEGQGALIIRGSALFLKAIFVAVSLMIKDPYSDKLR